MSRFTHAAECEIDSRQLLVDGQQEDIGDNYTPDGALRIINVSCMLSVKCFLFRVQLFADGRQEVIEGVTGPVYTVRTADIGAMVNVSCTPVRSDGVEGETVFSSMKGPISACKSGSSFPRHVHSSFTITNGSLANRR